MKKLLPLILLLIGTAAGGGVGFALRPVPEEPVAKAEAEMPPAEAMPQETSDPQAPVEYLKMNNQFVVPVVKNKQVVSLVVLALSLEVPEGRKEDVFRREPKVRDSFLQVLFDHANTGGFDGSFTDANMLGGLRRALHEVAQRDLGKDLVSDVLIVEIARQDY